MPSRRPHVVRLLDVDPDLGTMLSDMRHEEAARQLLVRRHALATGPWDVSRLAGATADHVGLLIFDGVLSRELRIAGQLSTELLGPGDLVRPWQRPTRAALLSVEVAWSVLSPVTVAVLDRRFAAEITHYPEVTAALFDRLSERSLRLATMQAISQLTCVDRRLTALFWHLAERWGRVSADGVIVPLALTHRILGQLVGARRPTVSKALSELAGREELIRRRDGSWLLLGEPPGAGSLGRSIGRAGSRLPARQPTRRAARFTGGRGPDADPAITPRATRVARPGPSA